MSDVRVAQRYAASLFELARKRGELEQVKADMELLQNTLKNSRELFLMLRNPIVKHDKKLAVLRALFEGKMNQASMMLFGIMARKQREAVLPEMAQQFMHQYNQLKGVQEAVVTTATPLTPELRQRVEQLVKQKTNATSVVLKEEVKAELIGGYILRIGDRQIDDSVAGKLAALKLQINDNSYQAQL